MYKKTKVMGFIPWFVKLDIDEAKTRLSMLEVLQAFAKSSTFYKLEKAEPLECDGHAYTFMVEGKSED